MMYDCSRMTKGRRCASGVFVVVAALGRCGVSASGDAPLLTVTRMGDAHRTELSAGAVIHTTTNEIRNARVIAVPATSALAVVWEDNTPDRTQVPYYTLSVDGESFSRIRENSFRIRLRYADFDPLVRLPAVPESLGADPGANELYIVQFDTPPLEAYRETIRGLGGTVYVYLAEQAHIVRMPAAVRAQVERLPFVRWIGAFHPAYRLDEQLLDAARTGASNAEGLEVSIQVWERGAALQNIVAREIEAIGGEVFRVIPAGYRLEARLTPEQVRRIAAMNEVWFIDVPGEPGLDLDIVREIGGANFIENTLGFTGQGVRGEIMDGGWRTTHTDFQSHTVIRHGPQDYNNFWHGTRIMGLLFGDGTSNSQARGLIPDGQPIYASHISFFNRVADRYQHTAELVDPNGPYRAVFQTNSWGNLQTRLYTTISAEMDDILFLNDILVTQSQSNTGNTNSRQQAWAKNIVAVGGVRHQDTLTRDDDCWGCTGGGASTGPASDGRVKPDLAHFYDNTLTTSDACDTCYDPGFWGTSTASALTGGHFGLLFQMWHEGVFPGFGGGATVFESRPHMTTAKALMINGAFRYDWNAGGPNGDLDRFRQGWGMPNLETIYNARNQMLIVDETDVLEPLQTASYEVTVEAGAVELKVTMVYADPMGNPAAAVHRINDLSLRVSSPSAAVYWGNNGLVAGNWSTSAGSSNTIDTVENVFISFPEAGAWTIEVLADEINQDSHVETPELDADFALVVSGIVSGGCPGDLNGDGFTDLADLGILLADFGCTPPPNCVGDLDGDGDTDLADLGILLADFGCGAP